MISVEFLQINFWKKDLVKFKMEKLEFLLGEAKMENLLRLPNQKVQN